LNDREDVLERDRRFERTPAHAAPCEPGDASGV